MFNKGTEFEKKRGKQLAKDLISYILLMFNAGIKIPNENKMDSVDIMEATLLLFDDMKYSRLEDLILCLKMAKEGKFGPIYNRVDSTVIFEFWRQYKELYQANFEREKILEKSNYGEFRTEQGSIQIAAERKAKADDAEKLEKEARQKKYERANFKGVVK